MAVAALLFLCVPAVEAQQTSPGQTAPPGPESGGLEVAPFTGILTPLAELSSSPESFATEVSASVAYGGSLTYWLPGGPGVGLQGLGAPARVAISPTEFEGVIPTDLGSATYLAATLQLLYRLQFRGAASSVEPFFALGGGLRQLTFDPIARPDLDDSRDGMLTAAAGSYVRIARRIWFRLELRDYLSEFESAAGDTKIQNDLAVSLGLGVRLR